MNGYADLGPGQGPGWTDAEPVDWLGRLGKLEISPVQKELTVRLRPEKLPTTRQLHLLRR